MERAFDSILKKTHPYLIFPSDDFKNRLAGMLSSLYQYYSEGNELKFEQLNKEIEQMIEDVYIDSHTDIRLYDFKYKQMTLQQAQQEITKRMIKTDTLLEEFEDMKNRLTGLESRLKRKNAKHGDHHPNLANGDAGSVSLHSDHSRTISDISDPNPKNAKKPSNILLVMECIKNSKYPLSYPEVAVATGLERPQVEMAIMSIKNRYPSNMIFGSKECERENKHGKKHLRTVMWTPYRETDSSQPTNSAEAPNSLSSDIEV